MIGNNTLSEHLIWNPKIFERKTVYSTPAGSIITHASAWSLWRPFSFNSPYSDHFGVRGFLRVIPYTKKSFPQAILQIHVCNRFSHKFCQKIYLTAYGLHRDYVQAWELNHIIKIKNFYHILFYVLFRL